MKLTTTALGLVLAVSASGASAQYGSAPPPTPQQVPTRPDQPAEPPKGPAINISSSARKSIVELQTAVNANDVAGIPGKLAAAQAASKTKEDKYIVAQLQLKAALAAKNNAAIATAIDAVAASGYVDAAKISQLYMGLGSQLYSAKQWDQAAAAFERASATNPANVDAMINLAETRFAQGRKAEAAAGFQRVMQARQAAGMKAEEALYKRAVGVAYDAQLPVATELSRQWVAAYPSPESWRNSIAIYRNLTKPDVEGTLDLLRLMQAAGALATPADYNLFATAAADQSNFVEAQAVIDAGLAAKHIDGNSPMFKDIIAALKTKPKPTQADLATATKTAVSGMAVLRIGDRYYAMGQYAKAVDAYRLAMGKPGVDPNVANLHIGMALARAGDKAGATTALNAVSGPRAEIAKYWLLYLSKQA